MAGSHFGPAQIVDDPNETEYSLAEPPAVPDKTRAAYQDHDTDEDSETAYAPVDVHSNGMMTRCVMYCKLETV